MKNQIVAQLIARYTKKLAKNMALQTEIEQVYQKLSGLRASSNPEALKLWYQLERKLLKLKEQNKDIQAILDVFQKSATSRMRVFKPLLPKKMPFVQELPLPKQGRPIIQPLYEVNHQINYMEVGQIKLLG